jgi:hypothetical protein
MSDAMGATVTINCPECEAEMKVSVRDAAAERTKTCPNGHAVKLNDKTGGAGSATKAYDDLMKKMKGLGK